MKRLEVHHLGISVAVYVPRLRATSGQRKGRTGRNVVDADVSAVEAEQVPGVGGSNVEVTRSAFWIVVREESCSQKNSGVTTAWGM